MIKNYLLLFGLLFGFNASTQIMFQETFDTGIPGSWTITDNLSDGNTWKGTTGGHSGSFLDGTEFAMVDSDADGNGINMVETLTSPVFDGTLYGPTVLLEFDQYFRYLTVGSDFANVEVFDGTTWQLVATFNNQNYGAWGAPDQQSIDISAYVNANMQVRFYFDDNNTWAWYWAVDNVVVVAPLPDDAGAVAILNASGIGLSAAESIEITVENFGAVQSNIPVYYSINGGPAVGPEVLAGPLANGATANHLFATTADFSATGTYLIEAWTAITSDVNINNDTVTKTIYNAINPVINLPFCADFEDATNVTIADGNTSFVVGGLPYLKFESGTNGGSFGRIRTEAGIGFSQSGTKALTIDMTPVGDYVLNYATLQLNMASYDANTATIVIDFSIMDHGDEVQAGDSVWIRGSDVDSWIGVTDWNALTGGVNGQYFTVADMNLSAILLANSQNFSSTFEFRIGQEDNFPATSIDASDGVSLDDVCIRQLLQYDATSVLLLDPTNGGCGSTATPVCATISNLGIDTLTSMPVTLNWTNGLISGTETINYTGNLASNQIDTVCFTPINTSTGGAFTFEVITELPTDELMSNDSLWATINLSNTNLDIDTTYSCLQPGDSLFLSANVLEPGANYNWYDSLVGGNIIYTGDTLSTGALFTDTSFFVESNASSSFFIGAPDLNIGGWAPYSTFSDGLFFDVTQAIVIDSLTIYPASAGDVVLNILDNLGTVVNSVTVTIPTQTVAFDPIRIGVNLPVGIGTGWQLNGTGSTVSQMIRNSAGGAFPYTEPGVMQITGAINGLPGYYYFWYDWQVTSAGCPSPRAELVVTMKPTVTSATVANDSLCINSAATTLGEGTPAGGTFSGTGVSGATFDPAVSGIGTHTITYTYTNASGCSGSADLTVTVDGCAGINELDAIPVNLFPNPATDLLNIHVAGSFDFTIVDMRGALVADGHGNNTAIVPTADFEAGVYFVTILTAQGGATAKLIVQ